MMEIFNWMLAIVISVIVLVITSIILTLLDIREENK